MAAARHLAELNASYRPQWKNSKDSCVQMKILVDGDSENDDVAVVLVVFGWQLWLFLTRDVGLGSKTDQRC